MFDNLGYVGEIQQKIKELEVSIKALRKTGSEVAMAEREYKKQLAKTALELRDKKMAVGMISLTIYGMPEVAELRFKRDIAETIYRTNQEHINATKLELRLLEGQVNREWGRDLNE